MYEYFDDSCAYCGIKEEEHRILYNQRLHKDHIIHDGSNGIDNCVPACRKCNCSKSDRPFEEWYKEREYFSDKRYNKILEWLDKW